VFRKLDSWKYEFESDRLEIQDFYNMAAGFKIVCKILKQNYASKTEDFSYHRMNHEFLETFPTNPNSTPTKNNPQKESLVVYLIETLYGVL